MDFTSISDISKSYFGSFYSQNTVAGKNNPVSFQAVLGVNMGEQGLEEGLKAQYPNLKYHVLDTAKINPSLWQRNDYPFELFFEDEFEKLLQQVNEDTDIAEMKKFLDEKFNVKTVVVDYSCDKTDTEAEMYDTAMLDKCDMHGGRNVIISRKALLRMKKDHAFRQKVYQSIEEIPWPGKLTGGEVKSNGVFIHEDGTGGYYLEFDWGDEEEGKKTKKSKFIYADRSEIENINALQYDVCDHMGFQTGVLYSLMGANFNNKKEE